MLTPAPAPLRRTRPRRHRRPLFPAERPAPRPVLPDDTQSLRPQAVAGALFKPPPLQPPAPREDERTGVTLPPLRSPSRAPGGSRRLGAPEREFLALFVIALGLEGAALLLGRDELSPADLLLSGAALLSGLGLLVLGHAASRPQKSAGRD